MTDTGREQSARAEVYREVAALVMTLPPGYRPQDVAEVIALSAAQIESDDASPKT